MVLDPILSLVIATLALAVASIVSLSLNQGPYSAHLVRKGHDGFWGPISSSIDWCEENYIYSPYVAELFNTVTSAAISFVGIVGIYACSYCQAEFRYTLAAFLLVIIGLGSMAFHAALQHWMQMFDEVPMLWLVISAAFCVIEHKADKHGGRQYGIKLPLILLVWAVVASCATIFVKGSLQVICFHVSFASAEVVSIYGYYRLYNETKDKETRRICQVSFLFFALSVLLWSLDGLFCSYLQNFPWKIPNPQLHAFGWHIGIAVAVYGLLIAGLRERLFLLKRAPSYIWVLGFWPMLTASPVSHYSLHDD